MERIQGKKFRMEPNNGEKDEEDRISLLPDDVICHIFSFLTTQDAVKTSVLSTRYRCLFASVPTIDLDFGSFFIHHERLGMSDSTIEQKFFGVMNRMLFLKDSVSIHKFCLRARANLSVKSPLIISSSISQAIRRRKIQVLDIDVRGIAHPVVLPSEIFICKTLVVLKLLKNIRIKIPKSLDLPNLKVLHLDAWNLATEDYDIGKVFVGCPLLEDLMIYQFHPITSLGSHVLQISIPSLKKLVLFDVMVNKIIIDTPNLLSLYFYGSEETILIKNLKSLVKAYIDVKGDGRIQRRKLFLSNILAAIPKVKSLYLEADSFQNILLGGCSLPKFHLLTNVVLCVHDGHYFELLPLILHSAPTLQYLVLILHGDKVHKVSGGKPLEFHMLPQNPICFSQHLEKVRIDNFCGDQTDFALVQYILQHGKALKRMIIRFEWLCSASCAASLRERLLTLWRSSTCEIVFA